MQEIFTLLSAFSIALIVTWSVTPLVKALSKKLGSIDHPGDANSRKRHKAPTPLLGGLAIYLGFCAASTICFTVDSQLIGILLGAGIALTTGMLDDRFGLKPNQKLLGQFLAAAVTVYFGIEVSFLSNPFGGMMSLGILTIPFTIIWLVALMNTINLIDGLDGLAAGIAAISSLIISIVAIATHQYAAAGIAIALLGASLGFLKYNFAPAQIFMGDSGSMVLGYILGVASIIGVFKSTLTLSVIIPVLAVGLPISDTIFAIIRRAKNKEKIFAADAKHIHHRLIDQGFTTKQTVWICYGLSLLLGGAAFAMSLVSGFTAQMLFIGFLILSICCSIIIRRKYQSVFSFLKVFL